MKSSLVGGLLWAASLRYLRRHPLQTGLAVGGVALGVAVVVAVDLANLSAGRSFQLSTEALTGNTTHQAVGGPSGLPDEVVARLVVDARIEHVAPIVEESVQVFPPPSSAESAKEVLRLLGIDPFSEAPFRAPLGGLGGRLDVGRLLSEKNRVILARQTAADLGLAVDDSFSMLVAGAVRAVTLGGILDPPPGARGEPFRGLVIADIATAQELVGRPGRLTRVDLAISEGAGREGALKRARQALPPGAQLLAAENRAAATAGMTKAFEVNLQALSLLALLCGTFLVFNTARFSVVQRRLIFGRLRTLGVTGRQLLRLSLAEAAVIGLAGGLLGVLLGILLGNGLVRLVTQTINDLYYTVQVRDLHLSPTALAKGLALGVGASLVGAWMPAREAASSSPQHTLSRAALETSARSRLRLAFFVGAASMAAGAALLFLVKGLAWSFAGVLLVVVGFSAWTPGATVLAMRLLESPARRTLGLVGAMAARGVTSSLSRTGGAIAALTLAVSVTVGVGVMIDSFRNAVVRWLDSTLEADLYVSPPRLMTGRHLAPLPVELRDALWDLEGVARVNTVRRSTVETSQGTLSLAILDLDEAGRARFTLLEGDPDAAWAAVQGKGSLGDEAVLVSEPFAYRLGVSLGDSLTLPTDRGEHSFRIASVYRDYGSDRGVVLLSRQTFDRFWEDRGFDAFSLDLRPEADQEAVMSRIRGMAPPGTDLTVRSNRDLRRYSLEIFDRTFLITNVLRLLAGGVAFLGVLGALIALQLERRRELALLRANGLTRRQLWKLVTAQTGLMGLVAGALSIPLGLILSFIMIFIINRRSFGWTLELQLNPWILVQALLLACVAAVLAGLLPARRMAASEPAEALRNE